MYRVYKRVDERLATLGVPVFIGDPPNAVPPPYLFVWGPLPARQEILMSGSRVEVDSPINVTVVHTSPANTLKLASQVESLLAGWTPHIDGWRIFSLTIEESQPVQTPRGSFEADTNRYPAWLVLSLRLRATTERENDG